MLLHDAIATFYYHSIGFSFQRFPIVFIVFIPKGYICCVEVYFILHPNHILTGRTMLINSNNVKQFILLFLAIIEAAKL